MSKCFFYRLSILRSRPAETFRSRASATCLAIGLSNRGTFAPIRCIPRGILYPIIAFPKGFL